VFAVRLLEVCAKVLQDLIKRVFPVSITWDAALERMCQSTPVIDHVIDELGVDFCATLQFLLQ
jgi:hypothetical protein